MIRVRISAASASIRARLRELLSGDDEVVVVGDSDRDADADGDLDAAIAAEAEEESNGDAGVEEHLTPRELEVLHALGRGLSNRAIAEQLGISEHTVKFHAATIYGKLGVSSRTEALREGLRRGLIEL